MVAASGFPGPWESAWNSRRPLMRTLMLAAAGLAAAAAALLPVSGASAQYYGRAYGYNPGYAYGHQNRAVAREMRECRRELRRADSRREYNRELRECQREIARARYNDRRYYGYRGYRSGYRYRGW